MRLDQACWTEVEQYLNTCSGIIIPCGSTEQHGPIGLIGTDAICAQTIAEGVGEQIDVYVAPTLAYTPAPFNMAFAGTMSISHALFRQLVAELIAGLLRQGFRHIYFLNGHGANLEPLKQAVDQFPSKHCRIRSWWDFAAVNRLRNTYYGQWEGMHATPSEIAITRVSARQLPIADGHQPPKRLSPQYIKEHAGDRHGPADEHRKQFPDGRVGSYSELATSAHGKELRSVAITEIAKDFQAFSKK